MKTASRQLPIPIVWVSCQLQVIDETSMTWKTVGCCPWCPNPIKAEIAKLTKRGIRNVWVLGPDGRVPAF